jgi:hypothetical protein
VGVLGAIAATQRLDEPDYLATLFEARPHEWAVNEMGYKGIARDHYMRARNQDRKERLGEGLEEKLQLPAVIGREHGKPREGASLATVVIGCDAPDAALSIPLLLKLVGPIFHKPIRRVGDDGMH